jgi:HEAT repeat protein
MRIHLGGTDRQLREVLQDRNLLADPVAGRLIPEFLFSPTERIRTSAALCLGAAGLGAPLTDALEQVISAAPPDAQAYLLRSSTLLGSSRISPYLLSFRSHPDAFVRANAAWALGRVLSPDHLTDVHRWLTQELAMANPAMDVVAALRQIVQTGSEN